MNVGCEDCKKCYHTCKNQFPPEYIDGGADKCSQFESETDENKIFSNMEKKCLAIKEAYAKKGIYI